MGCAQILNKKREARAWLGTELSVSAHSAAADKNQHQALRAAALLGCRMLCVSFHGVFPPPIRKCGNSLRGGVCPARGCRFASPPPPQVTPVQRPTQHLPPWWAGAGAECWVWAIPAMGEGAQLGVTWSCQPHAGGTGVEIRLSSGQVPGSRPPVPRPCRLLRVRHRWPRALLSGAGHRFSWGCRERTARPAAKLTRWGNNACI